MKSDTVQSWLDLKFGLFIHVGLYSVLGGVWKGQPVTRGYSEQILSHGYLPQADYEALKNTFTLENFDAKAIARLAKKAGMTYMVVGSKHHDGFCLYDTKTTDHKSKRDILRELSEACKEENLQFGVYFSWIDWHCPEALPISDHNSDAIPPAHQALNIAQLTELLSNYGQICELWMDMGAPTKEQSEEVYTLVQKLQPHCMVNGRIWNDYGDFMSMEDNQLPQMPLDGPWQTPASIYHETWGYRSWQVRGDLSEKIEELTESARTVVQTGGNYLLNIGLLGDGSVHPYERDVLAGMGENLKQQPLQRDVKIKYREPTILYHFTGSEYYSAHAIPTTLAWDVEVQAEKAVSLKWKTPTPLDKPYKLCLEVNGKSWNFSLQKDRSEDPIIETLHLEPGMHSLRLCAPKGKELPSAEIELVMEG